MSPPARTAESHVWKTADDPKDKIKTIVDEFNREKVETPREGLDMMCVADLGCWVRSTSVLTEQFLKTQNPQIGALLGKEALVFSGLRHKYDDPHGIFQGG